MNKQQRREIREETYVDLRGNNPIPGRVLKERILGSDFLTAWELVLIYIVKAELKPLHYKMMEHQYANQKSVVLAGPGYGKTFINNIGYVLTIVLRDPKVRIGVISPIGTISKTFSAIFKEYFKEGSTIYEVFGDLKEDSCGDLKIGFKGGGFIEGITLFHKNANSFSRPVLNHYDILILDNIVDIIKERDKEEVKKLIFDEVLPTLDKREYGRVHCLGYCCYLDDPLNELCNAKGFEVLRIESLFYDYNGELKSVWEEKIGVKDLLETREMIGEENFNTIYQQGKEFK